jgi:tRNA-specific 2-thiouridylase
MPKIFLGMSGGVDSTAAAIILKSRGHDVTGITLRLWDDASRCCDYEDIMDAKRACWKLGIKHYVLNLKRDFKKQVVDYFVSDYLSGRTPNPCVVCNEEIKFAALLAKVKEHGYDFAATGHYAVIEKKGRSYFLKKAADTKKSQEYFLARLKKQELKHILFPLGRMTKDEARLAVNGAGLKFDKPESQEVCFLKDGETPFDFIERHHDGHGKGGALLSHDGRKLKDLDSAYYRYTIGQRKGLGLGGGNPMYVISIDAKNKNVTVGPRDSVFRKEFEAGSLNMLAKPAAKKFTAEVKIRHMSPPAKASVSIQGGLASVKFAEPQFAVTPGQLAVFYNKNTVIGSGFII